MRSENGPQQIAHEEVTQDGKPLYAPYQVIEQTNEDNRMRLTVQVNAKAGSCLYSIVSLSHHGTAPDTGWEVTGYGKKETYEADKASGYQSRAPDIMSCYLVREPARR